MDQFSSDGRRREWGESSVEGIIHLSTRFELALPARCLVEPQAWLLSLKKRAVITSASFCDRKRADEEKNSNWFRFSLALKIFFAHFSLPRFFQFLFDGLRNVFRKANSISKINRHAIATSIRSHSISMSAQRNQNQDNSVWWRIARENRLSLWNGVNRNDRSGAHEKEMKNGAKKKSLTHSLSIWFGESAGRAARRRRRCRDAIGAAGRCWHRQQQAQRVQRAMAANSICICTFCKIQLNFRLDWHPFYGAMECISSSQTRKLELDPPPPAHPLARLALFISLLLADRVHSKENEKWRKKTFRPTFSQSLSCVCRMDEVLLDPFPVFSILPRSILDSDVIFIFILAPRFCEREREFYNLNFPCVSIFFVWQHANAFATDTVRRICSLRLLLEADFEKALRPDIPQRRAEGVEWKLRQWVRTKENYELLLKLKLIRM